MNFYINKSVFSFKFILILSTLLISFFKTASSSTTFTQTEIDIFEDVYNSFFCYCAVINYFEKCTDGGALKFIKYGLEKSKIFKNNPTKLAQVYCGSDNFLARVIDLNRTEVLELFTKYAKNGEFNFNSDFVYYDSDKNGSLLLESINFDFYGKLNDLNPLLYAVLTNKIESVKTLLKDIHKPNCLQLATVKIENYSKPFVLYVRTIARRIINKKDRESMLEALRADPIKHNMYTMRKSLGNDLKITVREAVLNNNGAMLEAALWLGNFGNSKADTNVIKYAVNNKRCEMVEDLVMEGFAKPVLSDAILNSKFSGNELERIKYILDPNQTRPPKSN